MTSHSDADRTTTLERLLGGLFNTDELRRWLVTLDGGAELIRNLPGAIASEAHLMHEAACALLRRGVDGGFFAQLRVERPKQVDEIDRVAMLFAPVPRQGALPDLLQSELQRTFRRQAIRLAPHVGRRVRNERDGQDVATQDLRSRLATGLNLLLGEQGLGKSSTLFQHGRAALQQGALVLAVRGSVSLGRAMGHLGNEAGLTLDEIGRRITHVLWDDFETTADALDSIVELPNLLPDAQVLAACNPHQLRRLIEEGVGDYPRWRLLPMRPDEARVLLAGRGREAGLIDAFAQTLGESFADLVGNPLFVECAADLDGQGLPPQLPRVVARYIDVRVSRSGVNPDQAMTLLLALAHRVMVEGQPATARQLRDSAVVDRADVPAVLDALAHQQLICVEQDRWYEFPHALIPSVLLARDRAERRTFLRAEQSQTSAVQEIALLSVSFARPAISALNIVAPNQDAVRMRALALLPHEEIPPEELARALREMVPLGDLEQDADALARCVDALKQDLSPTEATGLLRALVCLESRDPEFLGLLLVLLDSLASENVASAVLLRGRLLKHLAAAPPRPPTSPLPIPGRRVHVARLAVSWADLWQVFPGHQAQGQDPRLPVTRLSWLAARAFAAWWGARLPTNEEWLTAAKGMRRDTDDWRVAHVPRTHADLIADGPIPVDDKRLDRDPGLQTWRQLIGNVREWCLDVIPPPGPAAGWPPVPIDPGHASPAPRRRFHVS